MLNGFLKVVLSTYISISKILDLLKHWCNRYVKIYFFGNYINISSYLSDKWFGWKRNIVVFGLCPLFKILFTWFVIFIWVLVRQVFVHVLVSNAQSVVQHGQLLHGIGSFQYRLHFSLDESLGCEINLWNSL